MIWPTDGVKLAVTKLKTRRIRLGLTLFISSLLFVSLAGVLFTVKGVIGSVEEFTKEGLGSRFIVGASPHFTGGDLASNKDIVARTKVLEKEYIAKRKAEAKRIGIDYDPITEMPATSQGDGPTGKIEYLGDMNHPAVKQALAEYYVANPEPGIPELEKLAASYGPVSVYSSKMLPFGDRPPYLQVLKDNKEDFETKQEFSSFGNVADISGFSTSWQSFGDELLLPFVLPGQSLAVGNDGAIPVLAPYSVLEKLMKVTALPKSAKAKDKLARLEELRTMAAGFNFTVCYRNSTSQDRINQAIAHQEELVRNKSNKEYVKPELIYKLPSAPCADVVVERDVRSAETKKMDTKQLEFRQVFGEPLPISKLLTYKIVGIVPDIGNESSSTVQQILQSILTSSVGNGWFTPSKVIESTPDLSSIFKTTGFNVVPAQYYVELGSAEDGRRFIEEQNCSPDFSVMMEASSGVIDSKSNPFASCAENGKYFMLSSFGSNSLALDEFKKGFNKFFRIFVIIIMVIASLIMMGIVARIIADSRRETAVFRAIGAKRLDIAQIYLTYVVIICCLIAVIATVGGVLVGKYLQTKYGADMRIAASIAFNAADTSRSFSFSKITSSDLLLLWGVIFAVGGIGSALPLLSNLRRNPISDMRDDR
jgi:FtsX-like permease family